MAGGYSGNTDEKLNSITRKMIVNQIMHLQLLQDRLSDAFYRVSRRFCNHSFRQGDKKSVHLNPEE
jgi:hypothetical protein